MDSAGHERIAVELSPDVGARRRAARAGTARACVHRIEGGRGTCPRWDVRVDVTQSGYRTEVVLDQVGLTLGTRDTGHAGALAVWDAMCRLEQLLRARRGTLRRGRTRRGPASGARSLAGGDRS